MSASALSFVPCPACQGDTHLSLSCRSCHGAGIGSPSNYGQRMWLPVLDQKLFRVRKLQVRIRTVIHLGLLLMILACVALGVISAATSPGFTFLDLTTRTTFPRLTQVCIWFGLLTILFSFYRWRMYRDESRILPLWGKTRSEQDQWLQSQIKRINQPLDISPYFHTATWEVLEKAFHFAEELGKAEVTPVHLFMASLASPSGGIFMTRLGMNFDQIRDGITELLRTGNPGSPTILSVEVKKVLLTAYDQAMTEERKHVGVGELFLAAYEADPQIERVIDRAGFPATHVRHVAEWLRLQEQLRDEHDRFVILANLKPNSGMDRLMTARQTNLLDQFGEDLTLLARNGYISPVYGREDEMEEVLRAIEGGRRSVILVGEPGVGKMSLVELLARRMVEEDVPEELFDRRLVEVRIPQLIASGEAGAAMERLLALLREAALSGNVILVLQGIETLVGGNTGPLDLAETLATELEHGRFIIIATTTPSSYTNYLERRSLGMKLARVNVREPSTEDAIRMLMVKTGYLEYQNQVFFSYASIERVVMLCSRYVRDRALPESALEILQEAAVYVRKARGEHTFVSAEDVAYILQQKTSIPMQSVSGDESQKLLNLEVSLHKRVIGQSEAVTAVAQAMKRARAELRDAKRPIANFLFLGPTGVGKTELAKALAAEYFGSEKSMVRLDMSEYQDTTAVNRVIGAPGDPRGGLLTEAVRKNPFSIVLLDELEKAHPDILTLFLQVMDDGRLTDGVGRTIDFTNTVLIATSNAGTSYIQEAVAQQATIEQIKTNLLERELKATFRPEFLNRFDGVMVFKPLTLDEVTQIAWLLMGAINKRLEEKGVTFEADDHAVEALAKAGYDPLFGARPLRRVIQEKVDNALADLVLRGGMPRGAKVKLLANGSLTIEDNPT